MADSLIRFLKRFASIGTEKAADRWMFVLKTLISAGLLWYIVQRVGTKNIIPLLQSANPGFLFLAVFLLVPNIYLQFMKWKLLSHVLLQESSSRKVICSVLQGIAAGAFTPARTGEYIGRKFAFPGKGLLEVTIATFIDKLLSLFITVFAGALAAILFLALRVIIPWYLSGALLIAFSISTVVFAYLLMNQHTWHRVAGITVLKIKFLEPFIERIKMLKRLNTPTLLIALALSFMSYTVYVTQYVLLMQAFDPTAQMADAYWCGILMYFAKSAIPSISLGEIGVREMASVFFASQFNISEAAGLHAAFAIFAINIVIPALIGMLLFFVKVRDD